MSEIFDSIEARIDVLLTAEIFETEFGDEQELQEFDDPESMYEVIGNMAILLRDIFLELKKIKKSLEKEPTPEVLETGENYLYKTNLQDQNRPSCEFDQD